MTTDTKKTFRQTKKQDGDLPKTKIATVLKKQTKMATDKKVTLSLQPEVHKPMGRHGDRI